MDHERPPQGHWCGIELRESALSEVRWPAFATPSAANQLALQFQLEQSQWWEPAILRERQLRQLDSLLRYAVRQVPYWREVLGDAGADGRAPLTDETFSRIPILDRPGLQDLGDRLVSRQVPPGHGRLLAVRSSGSTGRPVSIVKTDLCNFFWKAFALRLHLWHRHDFGGRLASIRYTESAAAAPPDGEALPGWGPEVADLMETGPAWRLTSSAPLAAQAAWLMRIAPHYLVVYPSIVAELAGHFASHGLSLPSLSRVLTVGEVLPPDLRALCRAVWGAALVDAYSAEETGLMALQCPACEHYHVQAEGVLLEVLDDADRPCPPGGIGRVVATPLHNFATPLVRYALGDYAEVGDACPCGRGLPVLRRIVGRAQGMARLPDGRLLRPHVGFCDFAEVAPVRQAQLVQRAPDLVEARLVADRTLTPAECGRIAAIVQHNFDYPMRVTFSYLLEVERSPGGKFEVFRSELG